MVVGFIATYVIGAYPAQARCTQYNIRDRPFNLKGGVTVFCFVQKKYSDFGGGTKK
jgi:hypothetical protein